MRYANAMKPINFWSEIRKYFHGVTSMNQEKYFDDRFALWVDLRSSIDPKLHGNGLELDNNKGNLSLTIHKKAEEAGELRVFVFVIMDAVLEIGSEGNEESRYQKIYYELKK